MVKGLKILAAKIVLFLMKVSIRKEESAVYRTTADPSFLYCLFYLSVKIELPLIRLSAYAVRSKRADGERPIVVSKILIRKQIGEFIGTLRLENREDSTIFHHGYHASFP